MCDKEERDKKYKECHEEEEEKRSDLTIERERNTLQKNFIDRGDACSEQKRNEGENSIEFTVS